MDKKYIIAAKLFESLQLSTTISSNSDEDLITLNILSNLTDRQEILDKIIELLEPADNPEKRYLKAKALSWSSICRNKEAIQALELTLNDSKNENEFEHINHLVYYPLINNKNSIELRIHYSNLHKDLSDKYLKEYMFDEALENAILAYELTPFYPHIALQVIKCFVRRNELQNANLFYDEIMSGYYFNIDTKNLNEYESYSVDSFKKTILGHRKDLLNKINSGYVYKPKPRKNKFDKKKQELLK